MTDRDLLLQYLQSRDESAFAQIVRRHGAMVHAVATRIARQDADDIAQAVFLLLARRAAKLSHLNDLGGWLYHTARLTALNAIRQRARQDKHIQNLGQIPVKQNDPSTSTDTRDLVDTAISKLGDSYRQVLILRYIESLSLEESASRLGLTTEAVAKRAQRGLEKLRDYLHRHGLDYAPNSLAGLLQLPTARITESQIAAMTHAAKGSASKLAGSLAATTTTTATFVALKIAITALAIVAAIGITIAVVRSNQSPAISAAVAPAKAPPIISPPATMPALTTNGARQFATMFFSALRDGDVPHLAGLIDAPTSAGRIFKAQTYIAQIRDAHYARFPNQLDRIVDGLTLVNTKRESISFTFGTAPPTAADLQHVELVVKPNAGRWTIDSVTYTSMLAAQMGPRRDTPATLPKNPGVPKDTYTKALQVLNDMTAPMDDINPANLTEDDRQRMVDYFASAPAKLRQMNDLLKGTDLYVPPATIDKACDAAKTMHDTIAQEDASAASKEIQKMAASPLALEFARFAMLEPQLRQRADAEQATYHPPSHASAFGPAMKVTLAWDGSTVEIPRPLIVPPWLRQTQAYKQWRETGDIRTFVTLDDQKCKYEIFANGLAQDQHGQTIENISEVREYQPDGTLTNISQFAYDGKTLKTWSRVDFMRLMFRAEHRTNYDVMDFYNPDGGYREWQVIDGQATSESLYSPLGEMIRVLHQAPPRTAPATQPSSQQS